MRLPVQGGSAGISPMIWRRLLLRSDHSIADLHYTIQIAMGWSDSHPHRFHIHGKDYGVVQEIACLERKEHRLEDVGLTLREAKKLLGGNPAENGRAASGGILGNST
jgi:Plasmid pRiA4b ORF-3-like protein